MRVGFSLPQWGQQAHQADEIAWYAAEAERLGAASLWVGDRLLVAVEPAVGYGGLPTIPAQFRSALDPFTVLSVAAAVTSAPLLGSSVINLTWYPPVIAARALTSIDVISAGRLIPGFGIGWSPEEYQAAGVPFHGRGARLEESLDALEAIWAAGPGRPAAYAGAAWTVPPIHVELPPAQRPRPPIYLGGFSEAALRRVGRRADGWLPALRVPGSTDAGWFSRGRAIIDQAAADSGRDPAAIATIGRLNVVGEATPEEIAAAMTAAGQATGIDHMFVDLLYLAGTVKAARELAARILELMA